jgi:protein-S-isoprenylcysteine O-methyltransferase Ste14
MLPLSLIRVFLLIWGGAALMIRLFYMRRAHTRKAKPGVPQTPPHPLAVLAMASWFGVVGAVLMVPDFVDGRINRYPLMGCAQALGLAGLSFGLYLLIRSHQALGEFYGVKLFIKEAHRVIDIGPYRYIRHPMYTAYFIWFMATGLIIPHYSLAVILLTGVYGFYRMARGEEQMLRQALGASYEAYLQRTGMFFPRLPPPRIPPKS